MTRTLIVLTLLAAGIMLSAPGLWPSRSQQTQLERQLRSPRSSRLARSPRSPRLARSDQSAAGQHRRFVTSESDHLVRSVDPAVVIDLLTVAIRSGASIPQAAAVVGAATGGVRGQQLQQAARAVYLGTSWEQAWEQQALGQILKPAWYDGVDPTGLLAQAARSIRSDRRAAARSAAARLGVRLVLPIGLCLLPAFVLVGLVPVLLSSGFSLLG